MFKFMTRRKSNERREHPRVQMSDMPQIDPPGVTCLDRGGVPIRNAVILDMSVGGVALLSDMQVSLGEHLMFTTGSFRAPTHCEVLACDIEPNGGYRVRAKCIMGGFDVGSMVA